jgi:hypothetical protein
LVMLARAACPTREGTENEPLATDTEVCLPDAPTLIARRRLSLALNEFSGRCAGLSISLRRKIWSEERFAGWRTHDKTRGGWSKATPRNHRDGRLPLPARHGSAHIWASPHEDLLRARSESFACELGNFACETFSFRMSSAKPLKTLPFSRPRSFRFRGFQCYQSLAADFLSRFFSSRRFPVVGRRSVTEFSLPNISRYHRFSFLENQIPIMHRAASNSCRGDAQKPTS